MINIGRGRQILDLKDKYMLKITRMQINRDKITKKVYDDDKLMNGLTKK